jgi:antitoxin CcdA
MLYLNRRGLIMGTASNYTSAAKKATNVSLAENLLAEAKELRINISQAAEAGVARAVADRRAEIWLKENLEAIESSNAYVEKHGLPLDKYRMF